MPPPKAPDPLAGNEKYEIVDKLGSGTFGVVVEARVKRTGERVAIKFIERGNMNKKYVKAEVLNHRQLRHAHVIQFNEVFLTADHLCIVMEYANSLTLFDYLRLQKRLNEAEARWFFQQLIIGLDYCHQRGVVNRDVKLENALLQKEPLQPLPLLKICDFGYSKARCMSVPKSHVGTPCYMAPEVISTTAGYDGKAADIWSCGVMLYVMLFGHYPFESSEKGQQTAYQQNQTIMDRILAVNWTIPSGSTISGECRDLLHRMMVIEKERFKMEDLLRHPWFTEGLPPDALTMNEAIMGREDYSNVQTVDEINQILNDAQPASKTSTLLPLTPNMLNDIIDTEMAVQQQQVVMQTQQQQQQQQQQLPELL